MALQDSEKLDLVYKKTFKYTKTGPVTGPGSKTIANEVIASYDFILPSQIWVDSSSIPTIAVAVPGVVEDRTGTNSVSCVEDTTSAFRRVWKTNLTNWIPPTFGSSYLIKVYCGTTQLFQDGSGNNDEWYFDYPSGTLTFIGSNLPNPVTLLGSITIHGYRYIGTVGLSSSSVDSYKTTITGGVPTTYTVTHGLNSRSVMVQVYDTTTYETVLVDVERTTLNTVNINFSYSPIGETFEILIIKI